MKRRSYCCEFDTNCGIKLGISHAAVEFKVTILKKKEHLQLCSVKSSKLWAVETNLTKHTFFTFDFQACTFFLMSQLTIIPACVRKRTIKVRERFPAENANKVHTV